MAELNISTSQHYSDDETTFGERLAAARHARGLQQKDLAQRLSVRLKTIDDWENDRSGPAANRLPMLAGLLNVSMLWLLAGSGDGVSESLDPKTDAANVENILLEMQMINKGLTAATRRLTQIEKQVRHLL